MPRALRIYLVRHGLSAANLDNALNAELPDHLIPLAPEGHKQAEAQGRLLRRHFEETPDIAAEIKAAQAEGRAPKIRMWRSPYLRTRQTAEGLLRGLGGLAPQGVIMDCREKSQLREQEFGRFDGVPDAELPTRFPEEHALYRKAEAAGGRYWAQMPEGESRCNVGERVYEIFGTFHRDAERHGINTIIVVSHGVTIRAFVHQWMNYEWEWFEKQPNPGNCSVWLLENGKDRGFLHPGFRVEKGHAAQERRESGVIDEPRPARLRGGPER